jgi:5-methylcytosine-specific restriction endonuclease McrA
MTKKRAYKTKKTKGWRENEWRKNPYCHYCGKRILRFSDATADHVVPVSKGGYSKSKNYVLACFPCNSEKGSMDYAMYVKARSVSND